MFCGSSIMDLLVGGQFANDQDKGKGQVSRMISEESFRGYHRGSCRKDSSDAGDLVVLPPKDGDNDGDGNWYDGEEEVDLSQFENDKQTRDYFRRRIAIFEASLQTPVAANRRLAARKIEMEGGFGEWEIENECIPPRQLLMYLVR